jgi:hypothetical protein
VASTRDVKLELTRRVETVTHPSFLDAHVRPHFAGHPVHGESPRIRVIQLDGTGAATIEVRYEGISGVFAKLYPNDAGPAIYEKLRRMRAEGFGAGERYQVVEPLAFIPEYQMMLAREAPGVAVSARIKDGNDALLLAGVRESAEFLAKLHTWPLRIGRPWSLLVSGELLSLTKRSTKMVSRFPQFLPIVLEMESQMEALAEDTADGILAQSHGQFRPIHVFSTGDTTTVIDLDRSKPCDPARDVAEYVHRLRMGMFWERGSAEDADAPTRAFLDTYRANVPGTHTTNLRFHWARFVFHSLNRKLKESGEGKVEVEPTVAFYRSEFDGIVGGWYGI